MADRSVSWTDANRVADLLVAGSAVYDSGHPEKEARALLKMAQEAEQGHRGQNFHSRRAAAI